jgi:uncharacterized protein YrrD
MSKQSYRVVKMKKAKQLLGTEIVELESGKTIGKICNVIFLPNRKKLLGFGVNCGKWVKREKVLQLKDIENIGKDLVIIKNKRILSDFDRYPEFLQAINEKNRILDLKVITRSGEELGYIEDIILNEKDGSIEGYILTDGIIEDIMKGKSIIPFEDEIIFGEDTVIVNNQNAILKNDISIKKALTRDRSTTGK